MESRYEELGRVTGRWTGSDAGSRCAPTDAASGTGRLSASGVETVRADDRIGEGRLVLCRLRLRALPQHFHMQL